MLPLPSGRRLRKVENGIKHRNLIKKVYEANKTWYDNNLIKYANEDGFSCVKDWIIHIYDIERAKTEEDNLRHWIAELEKISPLAGEEEELTNRRLELMNAEKIIDSLNYAYSTLTQGNDVQSALRHAQSAMYKITDMVGGK